MVTRNPIHLKTIGVLEETHMRLTKLRKTKHGEVTMDRVITELLNLWGNRTLDPRVVAGKSE